MSVGVGVNAVAAVLNLVIFGWTGNRISLVAATVSVVVAVGLLLGEAIA